MVSLRIVHFPASVKRILRTDASVKRQVFRQEVLIHRDVQFVGAEVCWGMQDTVRHHEAVIKLHHHVRRQMANTIVLALSKTLHAGKELVLGHKWVQPHRRGVVMRRTVPDCHTS